MNYLNTCEKHVASSKSAPPQWLDTVMLVMRACCAQPLRLADCVQTRLKLGLRIFSSTAVGDCLVDFSGATFRLRHPSVKTGNVWSVKHAKILPETTWQLRAKEHHLIVGPNGGGKSSLCLAIRGQLPACAGHVWHAVSPSEVGVVSHVGHREIEEREMKRERDSSFRGEVYRSPAAIEVLASGISKEDRRQLDRYMDIVGFRNACDRPLRSLSTGEMRKCLILRILMRKPRILILDEPFDGLDVESREAIAELLTFVAQDNQCSVVMTTHRSEEILPIFTHITVVSEGKVKEFGRINSLRRPQEIGHLLAPASDGIIWSADMSKVHVIPPMLKDAFMRRKRQEQDHPPVIELKNVNVLYVDGTVALSDISWKFAEGENWRVEGSNGSGKSSLVALILGTHPQVHSNHVSVFGQLLGAPATGNPSSAKEQISVVSADLQKNYTVHARVLDVVCSGYCDSIGLYTMCTAEEIQLAKECLEFLGLSHMLGRQYLELSQGQQRLVLLARALVKIPSLLILDEPFHGLDHRHRARLKHIIELVAQLNTSILLVTHHESDVLPCITHVMRLEQGKIASCGPKREPGRRRMAQ